MILIEDLFNILKKNKISFFTGVPDSILKNFSNYFNKLDKNKHIIAVNEGSAVSIGIGKYLSTKKISCVYFQNSCYAHLCEGRCSCIVSISKKIYLC